MLNPIYVNTFIYNEVADIHKYNPLNSFFRFPKFKEKGLLKSKQVQNHATFSSIFVLGILRVYDWSTLNFSAIRDISKLRQIPLKR